MYAYMLTQLMGELLTHNGDGGAETCEDGHSEGGSDGQAIDEVMQSVA